MTAALAVAVTFAGCGGDGSAPAKDPGGGWNTLAQVDGSLLFTCAGDPYSGDVYVKESTGAVRRLTHLPRGLGATRAAWHGDDVLFVSSRDGVGAIQRLGDPAIVAAGTYPAVSDRGELAYVRIGRGDSDEVVRVDGGRRSAAGRFKLVFGLAWVGEHLVAVASGGAGRRAVLVTFGERGRTRLRLPGRRFGMAAVSRTGRLAYSYGGGRRPRLAVRDIRGGRDRVFRHRWTPLAWSPDSRRVLVETVERRPRLRIFEPDSGTVTRLGRPPCGYFTSAEWRADPSDGG